MHSSTAVKSYMVVTSPICDDKKIGTVNIEDQLVVTVDYEEVGGFKKFYLGQTGTALVVSYLSQSNKIKRDAENARFAMVFGSEMDEAIGVVIEYDDGTFFLHTFYSDDQSHGKDLDKIAASYILSESKTKKVERLKSWEQIADGAAIKEGFTSIQTNTGLWGQQVPIVNDDCNMCLSCILQCPDDSIDKNPITNLAELTDATKCKSCGICADVCNKDAVTMVDKSEVKAARENVFSGKYGRKIEIDGNGILEELTSLKALNEDQLAAKGYELLYKSLAGQSLLGYQILQLKSFEEQERHTIITFINNAESGWKKIIRPFAHILSYGFSDNDLTLASNIQKEGYYISCLPSVDSPGFNSKRKEFEGAGYTSSSALDEALNHEDYDAVVSAFYQNITSDTYNLISEKIGVFLSPFMLNFSRDKVLDDIIKDEEKQMVGFTNPHHDEERPIGKVLSQCKDICSGHRACTGCPIDSTFSMAMQCVREAFDSETIEIVNSGATGCAEVVSTVFPDTSWKKFLHTVFGGLGANLEGMNAAYRFLKKTGKIQKKFKFFGWAGDGATYDIGLQSLSGYLERGLATDSIYLCYDNGAYMNTGVQRSSATPMGAATSTTPIGDIIRGKLQFRKNLAEFANAHEGVYVATVAISSEIDFRMKLQKAARHDGPALIIAYSNCTTGHMTAPRVSVDQSKLAVECGYWPLYEIENGEKKITYEPRFIRKYEEAKQTIEKKILMGDKIADLTKELEEIKRTYQNNFTEHLAGWLRSEGRFALHFNKEGNLKNAESVALLLHLYEELKIDWNKLRQADRLNKHKEVLINILAEYLHEKDTEERTQLLNGKPDLYGISTDKSALLDEYISSKSLLDSSGTKFKSELHRIFLNIKRQLDPEVYLAMYKHEVDVFDPKKPKLNDELRELAACLYSNYFVDQADKSAIEQKAHVNEVEELRVIRERLDHVDKIVYTREMEESEKQLNRAVLGVEPLPGRIFARAGDGGVTSAKLFVSILRQIGIFGKAAPDYGPERRGAPVGTNFQLGGKELRTQASYDKLDLSIVKNPSDLGWGRSEWRDALNDGGMLVINTPFSVEKCRSFFHIPSTIKLYVLDATKLKNEHHVPETVSLMGAAFRALSDMGIDFEKEYLSEKWKMLLNKEFASKANRDKIVEKNDLCFWIAFEEVVSDFEQPKDIPILRSTLKSDGFEKKVPRELKTGSEAVAEAWRQINPGVFAMFPITPSTEVGQEFSKFWADGKVDTEYIHTESEHSSFMTIIAAAACGVRAVTSTASQGMLLGKEGGLLAATLRLPLVVNVGNRETNAPLSIHAGHTDVFQFRDDGWIQLFARNSQEAYDISIMGQKIAEEARLPVFICQDGFIVTHTKDMLNTLSDKEVKDFIGEYDPEDSLLTKDMTLNPISLQNYYSEHVKHADHAQKLAVPIIERVMTEFSQLSGRTYRRVRTYELEDAEVGIVCLGSTEGTVMDAIDGLRAKGLKCGLMSLKNFRPLPTAEIAEALNQVQTIVVMDRMGSLGTQLSPLATEIKAIIKRDVLNLEYGRGGRNTPKELIEEVYSIGFILKSLDDHYNKSAAGYLLDESGFRPLFSELELTESPSFVKSFKDKLLNGKFIIAFGPREHIDVRENSHTRDLKLKILALLESCMRSSIEINN
ncbi:MAG: hypothetical protein GY816_09770 [Cytophagales bacterium]|nr:hypothetical protein [Cytophagales bacterium]